MLVLGRREVGDLLDPDDLIDALAQAMADLSAGRASAPPRVAADAGGAGRLFAMPASLPGADALTAKLVTLFPGNEGGRLPTHQAVIVAFDTGTGEPVAVLDGTEITAARTAAGSALSVRLLARPDAAVLAILGTGVQARAHARFVPRVRDFSEVRIASRDPERARRTATELAGSLGIPARAAASHAEAMDGADVVCATTHAAEPVVRRGWVADGMHITSVGYNIAGREVDAATVAAALVVVESRSAALADPPAGSNDLLWAVRDGVIDAGHVGTEIGEVVAGIRPGRTSPRQITLYKSVGVAVQDAAGAALVLAAARERGAGTDVVL